MKKTVDIFSKKSQDSLKEIFRSSLQQVYSKDSSMVDYCMKQVTFLVPICNGKYIVELTKPNIETEFWFGESDMGQGRSHEENSGLMNFIHRNIEDYFVSENLSSIDNTIQKIKDVIAGKSTLSARHHKYYNRCPNSVIHDVYFENPWDAWYGKDGEDLSKADLKVLLDAYKLQREKFNKRLETYLKKYGRKHLRVSSYWIDR